LRNFSPLKEEQNSDIKGISNRDRCQLSPQGRNNFRRGMDLLGIKSCTLIWLIICVSDNCATMIFDKKCLCLVTSI
uniref:Ovule protein n=1 Tax=Ascaris lumbricoides TaxID=6252 RepID=A0A0M3IHP8_ASCLU